jgi:hypothetical protein
VETANQNELQVPQEVRLILVVAVALVTVEIHPAVQVLAAVLAVVTLVKMDFGQVAAVADMTVLDGHTLAVTVQSSFREHGKQGKQL